MGFNSPFNPNSPTNMVSMVASSGIHPNASNTPTAMGKSYPFPSFLTSAGAKLIVILLGGSSTLLFNNATLTRSLASLTSLLRLPTISKQGNPPVTHTSTCTTKLLSPHNAPAATVLYILLPPMKL